MNDLDLQGFALEQLQAIRNDILNFEKSLSSQDQKLLEELAGFIMLPPSRLLDAYRSAEQAAKRHPYAAIVEFGVYRGGGLAAMSYGASLTGFTCPVIGFDTFEGHTAALLPHEVDLHGNFQRPIFDQKQSKGEAWTDCDIKSVFDNYKAFMGELQHEPPP